MIKLSFLKKTNSKQLSKYNRYLLHDVGRNVDIKLYIIIYNTCVLYKCYIYIYIYYTGN